MLSEINSAAFASIKTDLGGLLESTEKVLVAVSGGGDSIALLHLLHEMRPDSLYATTVDHGLRIEAADEAQQVAHICAGLNVPHTTLKWTPHNKTAQSARLGRYALLAEHARAIGARKIALGHTLDDQAETLLMRAARAKPQSGTRGMTGMTIKTAYDDLTLIRPLLHHSRNALRTYLTQNNIAWIEDPSNENMDSERVRTRDLVNRNSSLPAVGSIARLADLSGKCRTWLSERTAHVIESQVLLEDDGFVFKQASKTPFLFAREVFSTLIWVRGGLPYRPAIHKFDDLVSAAHSGTTMRKAVGRCLVEVKHETVRFMPEDRRPKTVKRVQLLHTPVVDTPQFSAIERFRPSTDDAVYAALTSLKGA